MQRTDDSPVPLWYVSSPADPQEPPTAQRYPAAGEPNPVVSLWLVSLDGEPAHVDLPDGDEYIATVSWSSRGAPIVATLDRVATEDHVADCRR